MATISTTARPAYVYDAGGDQWVPIAWTVLGSGAASAPALTFTGDSNTGLWSPGADTVAFSTGGVERLRIGSTGNVGVGTSSPTTTLDVAGTIKAQNVNGIALSLGNTGNQAIRDQTGSSTSIYFDVSTGGASHGTFIWRSSNAYTERFRIDSSGNVGIGTSSPAFPLHISSATSSAPSLVVENTNTDATGAFIRLSKLPSDNTIAASDTIGTVRFDAVDTGGTRRGAAQIFVTAEGAATASAQPPTSMSFSTTTTGNSTTEKMKIDPAGLITGSGTSLGAWTSYTPTLGGTGWAIGNGTASGRYCQIGKIVVFEARVTFGSTSTFGAGLLTMSIPVTANGNQVASRINCNYSDTSESKKYLGTTDWPSTTAVSIHSLGTNSESSGVTSTSPITWATDDQIVISGTYQAA